MVCPPVGQTVDQPRVAVKGEDYRLISGEKRIKVLIGQPMRMFALRLKRHQINDVNNADLQLGKVPAENIHGRKRLQCRHLSGASHYNVRFGPLIGARPFPDADSSRRVLDGCIHIEELQCRLLSGDYDVDVIAAPQTVIGDGQQRVRVGRKIDPHDLGLLVDDVIDEAGSWWLKPLWSWRQTCEDSR